MISRQKLFQFLPILALTACLGLPTAAIAASQGGSGGNTPVLDGDRDGMPDTWEKANKLNPRQNDSAGDIDRDGLSNLGEYRSQTNPRLVDSNKNRIMDGSEDLDKEGLTNAGEMQAGTDPAKSDSNNNGVSDANEDSDKDGVSNLREERAGTNPGRSDSDEDGIPDGREVRGTVLSIDSTSGSSAITVSRRDGTVATFSITDNTLFLGPDRNSSAAGIKPGTPDGKVNIADIQVGDRVEVGSAGSSAVKINFSSSSTSPKGEAKGTVDGKGRSSISSDGQVVSSSLWITLARVGGSSIRLDLNDTTLFKGPDRDGNKIVNWEDIRLRDRVEAYTSPDGSLGMVVKFEPGEGREMKSKVSAVGSDSFSLAGSSSSDTMLLVDSNTIFKGPDRDRNQTINLLDMQVGDKAEVKVAAGKALIVKFEPGEKGKGDNQGGEQDKD